MKKFIIIWQAIKTWWKIYFQGKVFVLNNTNKKIHFYSCRMCDNINDSSRITHDEAIELIKNGSKMASCCKNKYVVI